MHFNVRLDEIVQVDIRKRTRSQHNTSGVEWVVLQNVAAYAACKYIGGVLLLTLIGVYDQVAGAYAG